MTPDKLDLLFGGQNYIILWIVLAALVWGIWKHFTHYDS